MRPDAFVPRPVLPDAINEQLKVFIGACPELSGSVSWITALGYIQVDLTTGQDPPGQCGRQSGVPFDWVPSMYPVRTQYALSMHPVLGPK